MESLRLYFKLVKIAFQSRLQYRADFITGVLGVIVLNAVQLGLIGILVSRFTHLKSWTLWEVVFLYCLWLLGHSLYSLFFWHIRYLEDYLVQGTFDQFLVRPASPFVLFLGREVQYLGVADATFAVTGLILSYTNLSLQWDFWQWLFFAMAIIAGALIESTLVLMLSCAAFWTGRSRRVQNVIMELNYIVQNYPMDIFGPTFRVIVTGVVPVAFMNYYPALMLLGKLDYQGPWWWLGYLSPVVALLLIGLANRVWSLSLRHYSSSGG